MKLIKKFLIVALVLGMAACDMTDLDLQVNPNAVTPENASLNDLYNNIQLTFQGVFAGVEGNPGAHARMYHNGNFTYQSSSSPQTFNVTWSNIYSGLFPDIDALLAISDESGFDIHSGSAKIMKAYAMMALVDLFNNVPYTEAGQGTDIISPKADDGESIYAAAIALLKEAVTQLEGSKAGAPPVDIYYNGSAAKWATLGRTLQLRAALTTRLVNGNAASEINMLLSQDIIDEASEDFQFNYGNQRNNPNSRHRRYGDHYEVGDGAYLSNYYMWLLRLDKTDNEGIVQVDPRIRYYFYRKVDDAVNQDATTFSCHFSILPTREDLPAHHAAIDSRLPYCVASEDGYSGRDHGNGEGIPPDGPIRTSYGLYPVGGQFDDDSFTDTRNSGTTGGLGQGIEPIMLASFVDFMRAEAALTIGTNDDARALLESGMRKSMAKVFSFESLVSSTMNEPRTLRDGSSGTVKELYGAEQADVDKYVQFVLDSYDAADADGKLDIVMKEYYIALWGNGLEAYNMYRRTGKPNNMQPMLESDFGVFSRSFFLPDSHVDRNANASQKALTDPVFWDDGSVDLY